MNIITTRPGKGQWGELCHFWNQWWHNVDPQALRIILSSVISHFEWTQPPVWQMLIGPSGTGKTSLAIAMVNFLGRNHVIETDSPTENSFLSGFTGNDGLLPRLPHKRGICRDGILTFADWSTVLDMPELTRAVVIAQLRRVYDGKWSKPVGNKLKLVWQGKCTAIAACTPHIDQYYKVWANLGQRFMMVRWQMGSEESKHVYAEKARAQLGMEKQINDEFRERVLRYVDGLLDAGNEVELTETMSKRLDKLAILTAKMRAGVSKTQQGSTRVVMADPEEEAPTRLSKAFAQVMLASARLARAKQVRLCDIKLAERQAQDSMLYRRWRVMNYMPMAKDGRPLPVSLTDLRQDTKQVKYEFMSSIQDLEALGLITVEEADEDHDGKSVWLTELGRDLIVDSGMRTVGAIPYLMEQGDAVSTVA